MTLSEKLYELRKSKNLTQDEVAEALGVSRQAVSKWEMGTGVPAVENLVAISEFFGVTVDSLVKDGLPAQAPVYERREDVQNPAAEPQISPYVSVKYKLNAVECSAILIMCGIFGTVIDYLLRLILARTGIFETGTGAVLIQVIGVISMIPVFIGYSLLFRCRTHGAGASFIGILGLSILFHAVTFEMYYLLNIDFIPNILDGVLSVASVLLFYLAAAGVKGFEGRKKYAKNVLIIFLTVYFLYRVICGFAMNTLLGNYIENGYGRLLYTVSSLNNAASFVLDICAKPVVMSVFYCGRDRSGFTVSE